MVRGTFSPARAWRPAVGYRLALTLGFRIATVWRSSRKCACRRELNSDDEARPLISASVEHLVALTHGGKDNDENCAACCKALNNLFGRMSLKEKLVIVLNQRGSFVCPATAPAKPAQAPSPPSKPALKKERTHAERFALVVQGLKKRGNAKPGTVEKLLNTIKSQMTSTSEPATEADKLLGELRARNFVEVEAEKVSYSLPAKGDA